MYAFLRRPRWLILGAVVGLITLVFVNLGLWQLRRLEERRFDNAIQAERRSAAPTALDLAISLDAPPDVAGEAHDGRPLMASGTYDPSEEVLLRSRTLNGEAGFHVITPLILTDGVAILVNRGWVPLSEDSVPMRGRAASPSGQLEVTGYAVASAVQPRFGPTDPPGDRDIFARADVGRIGSQVPYDLYPVVLVSQVPSEVPIPLTPDPLDDGPHLVYAIQWFAFALISVGGFAALIRSTAKKAEMRRRRAAERDPDAAVPVSP